MDSVARGVRFWQLVRLGVAGRAWASLLGVSGGVVGRARMACGRCECSCARRVIQKVGVMQHSLSVAAFVSQHCGLLAEVWLLWFASVLLHRVAQFMHLALRWLPGRFLGD